MSLKAQNHITLNKQFIRLFYLITLVLLPHSSPILAENQSPSKSSLFITIDGLSYNLILTINPRFHYPPTINDTAQHFMGVIDQNPYSWARLSHIKNQWQGVVSIDGNIHNVTPANSIIDIEGNIIVSSLPAERGTPLYCGSTNTLSPQTISAAKIIESQTINYSTLCEETLNGICIVAELELAFDQAFQARYPNNAEDQANSLINIVEGYYINGMNIGFSQITSEFLSIETFSTSTDAISLLDDIQSKKGNQQLSFIKNDAALFHFITGREFDTSTVGVAYLGTLCDTNGYSVGTSQLVSGNIPLTALVVAHEIGHNMGSSHDDPGNNICESGFIMAPSLSSFASQFSSCSIESIQSTISNTNNIEQCINFAADVTITASESNVTSSEQNETTTDNFTISASSLYQPITTISVTGTLSTTDLSTPLNGQFTSVSLSGETCTIASNGFSYQCLLSTSTLSNSLIISTTSTNTSLDMTHTANIASPSTVIDINTSNNTYSRSLTITKTTTSEESTTPEVADTPTSSTNINSDNGGGGGGSFGWGILAGLFLVSLRRW
ncbi:hypothetical protein A9Q81_26775 [Gammaproteobacteria bacterium 42_54_T18]|nr:hypothetical protein A9Q81_26775 [Gammaproteobacteria bacterium 42_54_T18]